MINHMFRGTWQNSQMTLPFVIRGNLVNWDISFTPSSARGLCVWLFAWKSSFIFKAKFYSFMLKRLKAGRRNHSSRYDPQTRLATFNAMHPAMPPITWNLTFQVNPGKCLEQSCTLILTLANLDSNLLFCIPGPEERQCWRILCCDIWKNSAKSQHWMQRRHWHLLLPCAGCRWVPVNSNMDNLNSWTIWSPIEISHSYLSCVNLPT